MQNYSIDSIYFEPFEAGSVEYHDAWRVVYSRIIAVERNFTLATDASDWVLNQSCAYVYGFVGKNDFEVMDIVMEFQKNQEFHLMPIRDFDEELIFEFILE